MSGAPTTLSTNPCDAVELVPLYAVKVIGKLPAWVGVPVSCAPTSDTPWGSAPVSENVGYGVPCTVTVKVPRDPLVKVAVDADVMKMLAARVMMQSPWVLLNSCW